MISNDILRKFVKGEKITYSAWEKDEYIQLENGYCFSNFKDTNNSESYEYKKFFFDGITNGTWSVYNEHQKRLMTAKELKEEHAMFLHKGDQSIIICVWNSGANKISTYGEGTGTIKQHYDRGFTMYSRKLNSDQHSMMIEE